MHIVHDCEVSIAEGNGKEILQNGTGHR